MRPVGLLSAFFAASWCGQGLALAAEGAAAANQGAAATLEVSRTAEAEACVDRERLAKSVETRLRRAVFAHSGSAPLALVVELGRRDSSWLATVRIADHLGPLGERQLSSEARHCSALDDSLALIVALLVDTPPARSPEATAALTASQTTPPAPAKAEPAPAATPLVLPPDTGSPREPVRFGARAMAAIILGLLPGAAAGIDLGVAARFPSGLRLQALGDYYFERTAWLADGTSGVELGALRAGLEVCGLPFGPRRLSFELCVGQLLGRLSVNGVGFDRNTEAHQLLASLAAGVDARFPLTEDFGLLVVARAEVPLTRDRFTGRPADGTTAVIFQPAPLFGLLKVGIEVAP